MPTVSIEMFAGRTADQKRRLVREVTDAVTTALGVDVQLVRVKLYEIDPANSATAGVLAADVK